MQRTTGKLTLAPSAGTNQGFSAPMSSDGSPSCSITTKSLAQFAEPERLKHGFHDPRFYGLTIISVSTSPMVRSCIQCGLGGNYMHHWRIPATTDSVISIFIKSNVFSLATSCSYSSPSRKVWSRMEDYWILLLSPQHSSHDSRMKHSPRVPLISTDLEMEKFWYCPIGPMRWIQEGTQLFSPSHFPLIEKTASRFTAVAAHLGQKISSRLCRVPTCLESLFRELQLFSISLVEERRSYWSPTSIYQNLHVELRGWYCAAMS